MAEYHFQSLDAVITNSLVAKVWRFTAIILLVIMGFLFLPWQQTVKGTGTLVAYDPAERVRTVSATIDGVVETFHVGENAVVAKGDRLFTMVDLDATYAERIFEMQRQLRMQMENTRRESEGVRANRDNAKAQKKVGLTLFDQRRAQAVDTLQNLQLKGVASLKQRQTAQANFERTQKLFNADLASHRDLERADNAFVAGKMAQEKIEVDMVMQKRNLKIIAQERMQFVNEADNRIRTLENSVLSAQNRLSVLQRESERLKTDSARYASSEVRAQADGMVIRILGNDKNRFVRRGEPVMQFAPNVRTRALLLKVSDFNMPLIHRGLKVRIRFYGWPALQISGWPTIRYGTFGGIVRKVDPVAYEKGFYYAYVFEDPAEPWPSNVTLRLGTQATAWVALETVPVWYQLWRLMNAFPPKMMVMEGDGL